ncbi:MAG: phosphatase PAP2 family protein [Phycisphaerales bacterium JB040]
MLGLGLVGLAFPAWYGDAWVHGAASGVRGSLGGDVVRELEAAQQFGGLGSVVVVVLIVVLMDRGRCRRLLDLVAAWGLTGLVVLVLKLGIGRPRPKFGDAEILLWPWGAYPLPDADPPGVYHAWELWAPISSDLWSMPSSHTSAAVALAVWLGVVYPRLRPLVVGWVVLVGASRVLFGAHYLSDVFVGAGVALLVAWPAARGYWGVRFLDWVWVRAVDRTAEPALPGLLEREGATVGERRE